MIVFGEAHLRRILGAYAAYYNELRTHRSLNKDAPFHRAIHLTPQDDQLMSERCILCLKPALRLEWRGHESKE